MKTEETYEYVKQKLAEQKILVAGLDAGDDQKRTIVLTMNEDGTVSVDTENDPDLVAHYQEQINELVIFDESSPLPSVERPKSRLRAMTETYSTLFGAALAEFSHFAAGRLPKRKTRHYGPCRECGKPTKGGHCYTCRSKAA